jgi:hypothetical protein
MRITPHPPEGTFEEMFFEKKKSAKYFEKINK